MERRKFVRINQKLTVTYKLVDTPYDYTESTKDISEQGLCIRTHRVIDINSMIEIELELQGDDEPIMCLGLVLWSRLASVSDAEIDQPAAETGVRIVSINPKDQLRLSKYTQSNSPTE